MKKIWIHSTLLFLFGLELSAQENLTLFGFNPVLYQQKARFLQEKKEITTRDTLELPFFDDFSIPGVYPDQTKWLDMGAYINSEMALQMVSIGVASLDVLDSAGTVYPYATTTPFMAESLTSAPINLDLPAGSGVFLSFFYQPGGRVNPPESQDSLLLEFRSPLVPEWEKVWSTPGFESDTFHHVILPVDDPRFLVKGFQFRFRNYASILVPPGLEGMAGNQDIWHLDYIFLDKDRSENDTVYRDVAFVEPLHSLLVNYEAIPWHHWSAARLQEMYDSIYITYRNNGTLTNVTRYFKIRDSLDQSQVYYYSGGADNIEAQEVIKYGSKLVYTFSSPATDSALFEVKSYLNTDPLDFRGNDTIRYYQRFNNYYSYDDGSPESGYLVNGEGMAGAMVALRYKTYLTDSLRAVDILFNSTYQGSGQDPFTLAVWDDQDGFPGNLIYSQECTVPETKEKLLGFHTIPLEEPVEVSGNFYVGYIQSTDQGLNIGADLNRDRSQHLFYYAPGSGEWKNTSLNLSLMVRPILGSPLVSGNPHLSEEPLITLYPNPADAYITLHIPGQIHEQIRRITLINSQGQIIRMYTEIPDRIDLSSFPAGFYFLMVERDNNRIENHKFMIIK
ncbi:MAG: T9SS type A sorting domain-containing protein [Bacteroidales bacterium]